MRDSGGKQSISNGLENGRCFMILKNSAHSTKRYVFPCMGFGWILFISFFCSCQQSKVGEIEGTVALAGQTDLEGIQILLPGTQYRAITNRDGGFTIVGLPPGEYEVVMKHPGYFDHRETVLVKRGERSQLPPVELTKEVVPAGSISGFIRLPNRENHEGIIVVLLSTEFSVSTSKSGFFRMDDVPPGTYVLLAMKEGWLPAYQKDIEVNNGVETQIQEVELKSAGFILEPSPSNQGKGSYVLRGSAFLENSRNHKGIRVNVEDMPTTYAVTSASGFFEISGLNSEPKTLIFSHEGYQDYVLPNRAPVPATSSSTIGFIITLYPDDTGEKKSGVGILQGHAYLKEEDDHANITVRLLGIAQSVWTDVEGRYMFVGVPAGTYILVAEHPGYQMGRIYGVNVLPEQVSQATDVILIPAEENEEPGTGSVRGTAFLEGESDHGGITVALEGTPFNVVTGPSGEFVLENIPVNAYTLIYSKGGYKNFYLDGVDVLADQSAVLDPVILQKDVEPPFVVETFPRDGARNVPIVGMVDIIVRFSERMAADSVKRAIIIEPQVDFDAFFNRESELSDMDVLHIRLYQEAPVPVQFRTRYNVVITPEARTPKGVRLAEPYGFSFTTDGPLIINTVPPVGARNALINTLQPIVIETNAPIDPNSFERSIRFNPKPDSVPVYDYAPTNLGTRIMVRVNLRQSARYRIQIDNSLRTVNRQRFGNTPFFLYFTTAGPAGPGIERYSPRRRE